MENSCGHPRDETRVFCPQCGKVQVKAWLKRAGEATLGIVDVRQSTNPEIERFWATGDTSRI